MTTVSHDKYNIDTFTVSLPETTKAELLKTILPQPSTKPIKYDYRTVTSSRTE